MIACWLGVAKLLTVSRMSKVDYQNKELAFVRSNQKKLRAIYFLLLNWGTTEMISTEQQKLILDVFCHRLKAVVNSGRDCKRETDEGSCSTHRWSSRALPSPPSHWQVLGATQRPCIHFSVQWAAEKTRVRERERALRSHQHPTNTYNTQPCSSQLNIQHQISLWLSLYMCAVLSHQLQCWGVLRERQEKVSGISAES